MYIRTTQYFNPYFTLGSLINVAQRNPLTDMETTHFLQATHFFHNFVTIREHSTPLIVFHLFPISQYGAHRRNAP